MNNPDLSIILTEIDVKVTIIYSRIHNFKYNNWLAL